jgi:hypothetical protein
MLAALAPLPALASPTAPPWLAAAAARPTPQWAARSDALVLLDTEDVTVPAKGRTRTMARWAVRVLTPTGGDRAEGTMDYPTRGSKIVDFRAWHIHADGRVEELTQKDAEDMSLVSGPTLVEDTRALHLRARQPAVGDVFGIEWTLEEDPYLAHWSWGFQDTDPVLESSLSVSPPPGFDVAADIEGAGVDSSRDADRRTWTARDLHPVPDEDDAPSRSGITPWLSARLHAAGDEVATPGGTSLVDWRAVSRWYSALSEPAAALTPALSTHAAGVVAGLTDDRARTAALGRDAQSVRYVEVSLDRLRGGGHRPRDAGRVLELGYGDCKDKANLLRTLLRTQGLPCWLVLINAEDEERVRQGLASPWMFDHCIVAVPAAASDPPSSTVNHPQLGRLLLFDPTSNLVPFGDVPDYDRGRLALVVDGDSGCVLRTPDGDPSRDAVRRSLDVQLSDTGALAGAWNEECEGSRAVELETLRRDRGERGVLQGREVLLAAALGPVDLRRHARDAGAADSAGAGADRLDFDAESATQQLGPDRRVVRIGPLPAAGLPSVAAERRTLPVRLEPQSVDENWRVTIPAGWKVASLPETVRDSLDFGRVDTRFALDGQAVTVHRTLRVEAARLPAERWPEVRRFVRAVQGPVGSRVVLTREP